MSIVLENVSYVYAPKTPFETTALHDISLTVEDGEFIGIMGHTGCGKSTLIQLMGGLMVPTSGRILLDGRDINEKSYDRDELRKKIGIVFQYPEYQLFEQTVEKDVAFGLKYSKLSKAAVKEQVRWALEMVGFHFNAVRNLSPLGLSGGEKRKVAIAGVLAAKPKILILDEPIAGLDPFSRDSFLLLMEQLNKIGTTIIMVSHNADALGEYAHRILIINQGEQIMDGTTQDIFYDVDRMERLNLGVSQSRKIAELLGKKGIEFPQKITKYSELILTIKKTRKGDNRL